MIFFFSRFCALFCVGLLFSSLCFATPGYLYDSRRHKIVGADSQLQKKINRFALANSFSRKNAFFRKKNTLQKQKTTLLFSPHPDDEVLCCSGIIQEALQKGNSVKIVVVTNGEAFSDEFFLQSQSYGRQRVSESLAAARKLGLEKKDIFFLGFPDQGLQSLSDDSSYTSPFTRQNTTPPQSFLPFRPYTSHELEKSFLFFLSSWDLDSVYIPSSEDQHPDHRVVGKILSSLIQTLKKPPKTFTYLIHNDSLFVDQKPQKDIFKLSLIHLFASQFWTPQHKNFLEQFSLFPESFSSLSFQ